MIFVNVWRHFFFNIRTGRMLLVTNEYARDVAKHPTLHRMHAPLPSKIYPVQNGNCNEFKKTCLRIKWNNSFVQTISLSFQSLVQAGEIYKTFPILDWNINILYSFALIMLLHFRHIFKCYQLEECSLHLPDGCINIICTWPSAT